MYVGGLVSVEGGGRDRGIEADRQIKRHRERGTERQRHRQTERKGHCEEYYFSCFLPSAGTEW